MQTIEVGGFVIKASADEDGHLTLTVDHDDASGVIDIEADVASSDAQWGTRFTTAAIEAHANPHAPGHAAVWKDERDGYTHLPSGWRVVPCGPCTFAVVKDGRQIRCESGRLRRWLNLEKAQAFVEQTNQ